MSYEYEERTTDDYQVFGLIPYDDAHEELQKIYRKAEAFDCLYAEFDKGDKDLSKADFDEVYQEDK